MNSTHRVHITSTAAPNQEINASIKDLALVADIDKAWTSQFLMNSFSFKLRGQQPVFLYQSKDYSYSACDVKAP